MGHWFWLGVAKTHGGVKGQYPCRGRRGWQSPLAENGLQSFQTPLKAFFCHILYSIGFIYKFTSVENELFSLASMHTLERRRAATFCKWNKIYNKNICHIVWVNYRAGRLSFFSFNSSLESGGQNIYLVTKRCRPGHLFSTSSRSRYLFAKKNASPPRNICSFPKHAWFLPYSKINVHLVKINIVVFMSGGLIQM